MRRATRWGVFGPAILLFWSAAGCGSESGLSTTGAQLGDSARITTPDSIPAPVEQTLRASVRFDPPAPKSGDRLEAVARSVAGATFEYEWRIDGRRVGDASSSLSVPQGAKGQTIEVHVTPRDGVASGTVASRRVTVGNHEPVISNLIVEPTHGIAMLETIRASARATDADHEPVELRFTWTVNGRKIDSSGDALDPSHFDRGDRIAVEVVATDAESESETLHSAELLVENIPPIITSQPSLRSAEDRFEYSVQVEDPDDRMVRFSLLEGPPGMTIDWLSGTLDWDHNGAEPGTHAVKIEADDQHGGHAVQAFSIDVAVESSESQPPASRR